MAAAFFNALAAERGLSVRATSAGTAPGERINPTAVEVMGEIGISLDGSPQLLTPELARASGRVITMGCGVTAALCPAGTYLGEDWGLPDPHGKGPDEVRTVRDAVRARVEGLLDELS
jgi:arsenate reductase